MINEKMGTKMAKKKKVNVFIDTNIYINKQYNLFKDSDFLILSQYISEGKVQLITHKVVIEEIKKHFRSEVIDNLEKYNAFRKKMRLLESSTLSLFQDKTTCDDLVATGMTLIDDYFISNKAKILNYSGISVESLFNDYFSSKPPFESQKDKKSEFPDAVIMASLLKCKLTGGINIITNDKAWKEAFKSDSSYVVTNNIKDFLDQISKAEELYIKIQDYYQLVSSKQRLKMQIEKAVESSEIRVDGLEYDRKGVVSGVDYDEVYLNRVSAFLRKLTIQKISHCEDNNEIEVSLNYKVLLKIELSCYYTDYEDSIWDSEDKKYIFRKTNIINEIHKTIENISFLIKFNLTEGQHVLETLTDEFDLNLDQYTLIERTYSNEDYDDFYEDIGLSSQVTKQIVCEKCQQSFSLDFSQYVENTSSWEHGEDQMGSEIQYDIEEQEINCPHCNARYKISGNYNEYPVGALNYDNTSIELLPDEEV